MPLWSFALLSSDKQYNSHQHEDMTKMTTEKLQRMTDSTLKREHADIVRVFFPSLSPGDVQRMSKPNLKKKSRICEDI